VPARILPVANQAPHKTEGLPRRLRYIWSAVQFRKKKKFKMAESGEENVEISEAIKEEAETVKAKANEFFKGKLQYFIFVLKCFHAIFCIS
jgi:hypothetical protein